MKKTQRHLATPFGGFAMAGMELIVKKERHFVAMDDIVWPVESHGECKNARNCHNRDVPLANGVCVKCWDRGIGKPFARPKEGQQRVAK